jgi:hypothetical protein
MGSGYDRRGPLPARRTLALVDARTRQWVVLGTLVLLMVIVVLGAAFG